MKRTNALILAAALALALVTIFNIASASASGIVSEDTVLVAEPTGPHIFHTPVHGSVECEAKGFEHSGPTSTDSLEAKALGDFACTYFGGNTSMKLNGCTFTFHPGAEQSAGVFGGTVDLGPSGCGPLSMKYNGGCELLIYPKSGLSAEYKNVSEGSSTAVEMTVRATGLKYGGACSSGGGTNATYVGSWKLKGISPPPGGVKRSGVWVSQLGVYATGGEHPKFNAETYPASIPSVVNKTSGFHVGIPGAGEGECTGGKLMSRLSQAESSMTGTGSFEGCTLFGYPESVIRTNSCGLKFGITTAAGGLAGNVEIACEKSGDSIELVPEFLGVPACVISLPPQSFSKVSYGNSEATGNKRSVTAIVEGKGIRYSQTVSGCGAGSGESGTLTAVFDMGPGFAAL